MVELSVSHKFNWTLIGHLWNFEIISTVNGRKLPESAFFRKHS